MLETLDDWIHLVNSLGITDEYGTFLDAQGRVKGNMDVFARDVRAKEIVLK